MISTADGENPAVQYYLALPARPAGLGRRRAARTSPTAAGPVARALRGGQGPHGRRRRAWRWPRRAWSARRSSTTTSRTGERIAAIMARLRASSTYAARPRGRHRRVAQAARASSLGARCSRCSTSATAAPAGWLAGARVRPGLRVRLAARLPLGRARPRVPPAPTGQTSANTRDGEPVPSTSFSGATTTIAPVRRQLGQVRELREAVLARAEQEVVDRERRVEGVRGARVGADGLARRRRRSARSRPASARPRRPGRASAPPLRNASWSWARASQPVRRNSQPPGGQRAVLVLPGLDVGQREQVVRVRGGLGGLVDHRGRGDELGRRDAARRPRRRGR